MNIDWDKVCNEYLPVAIISIVLWQVLEGFTYLFAHPLYLGFRNLIWNPWVGVPFGIFLAFVITKIMHRPRKQELIIFIAIIVGMLLYIYGAVGWHPELTLPN